MPIPEQLAKQKAAVEEHFARLSKDKTDDGDLSDDKNTLAGTPEADPSVSTPAPATVSDTDPPAEDFEHKYKVMQGKYNVEVPRLHQTVREQAARLQSMEQLIATMQQQAAEPAQRTAELSPSLVTEEDKNAYGDSIDVMRRVCREEINGLSAQVKSLSQVIQQLQASIVPQVNAVAQKQARTADEQFWVTLNTLVPNWQAINDDDRFKSWLLEHDPLAGTTRQALLEVAHGNLDARRVASFFSTWANMNGVSGTPNRSGGKKQAVSELEAQVSPGRGRSAAPPVQGAPKQFTRADVSKFYDDVRKGTYKGRDEERARLERDIFVAMKEGRVG